MSWVLTGITFLGGFKWVPTIFIFMEKISTTLKLWIIWGYCKAKVTKHKKKQQILFHTVLKAQQRQDGKDIKWASAQQNLQ